MGGRMQAASPLITLSPSSPSFNSYSSGKFAEIAARVVQEFSRETPSSDIFSWTAEDDATDYYEQYDPQIVDGETHQEETQAGESLKEEEEEAEFEFAVVNKEADAYDVSSTSADDIFYNGQIRPIYPLFNTSLIYSDDIGGNQSVVQEDKTSAPEPKPKRPQLRKLFSEERDTAASCSSSEADELDGASPGTYCVWAPKKKSEEEEGQEDGKAKKSRSTGSKRWKIKDLLVHSRSNSDGKEAFVFLPPPPTAAAAKKGGGGGEGKLGAAAVKVEEHRVKRRPYLPYRPDLVGFLSNVNGLGKNLHPF